KLFYKIAALQASPHTTRSSHQPSLPAGSKSRQISYTKQNVYQPLIKIYPPPSTHTKKETTYAYYHEKNIS
ncbi:MAG: hypothetical protein ACK4V4_02875, partial [Sphingobacteriales bacterium]